MIVPFIKFDSLCEAVAHKKHNLASDTLKVMLTNAAPDPAGDAVKSDLTEIAAGNGYTAGGATITVSSSGQTAGVYKLVLADVVITASGGSIGPFRYAAVYNDTAANDELLGYLDYGTSVSIADGETATFDFSAADGVFTLA